METWEKITGGVITFAFGLIGILGKRNLDQIDKRIDDTQDNIDKLATTTQCNAETTQKQAENIASLTTAIEMVHESTKMLLQKAIDD